MDKNNLKFRYIFAKAGKYGARETKYYDMMDIENGRVDEMTDFWLVKRIDVFTGFQDKKGDDIYNNDELVFRNEHLTQYSTIFWDEGRFCQKILIRFKSPSKKDVNTRKNSMREIEKFQLTRTDDKELIMEILENRIEESILLS